MNKNLRMCSPPEARKNKTFKFQNETSPNRYPENFRPLGSTRSISTETVICSSRTEVSFTVDGRSESTPLPRIDCAPLERKEQEPEQRHTPSVADVTYVGEESDGELKQKVAYLEKSVDELKIQNENLTAINDRLVDTLEEFKAEQAEMWKAIRNMIPTPQNVISNFLVENEDGHHVHQVRWDMPAVKEFRIFVDGNQCGQIKGKNNSARITDLTSNEPHTVQIQAVGNNGLHGEISKKLHIVPK